MELVRNLWKKWSHTKALDQSSGKWETVFFESVYRSTYMTGLSIRDDNIIYLFYTSIVRLLIVLLMLGEIWYILTEASNLDEIAFSINVLAIQSSTMYRHKNLIEYRAFFKKLAASMESPYFDLSTEGRKKLVEQWSQRTERFFNLLYGIGSSAIGFWFIFPLIDEVEYNLLVGIRLPFNHRTPETYPYAYCLVLISFAYIANFVMVTDSQMQAYLIHILCQYAVLADCFENILIDSSVGFENLEKFELLRNKNFADKFRKKLGNLLEQHKLILSHSMELRSILSGPMLVQLASSFILFCFVGFQTATTVSVNFAMSLMSGLYLAYNIFGLYIICKWCEEITNWSEKIGEAAYFSGWECGVYEIPGVKSTILFVIARANRPVVFTAGGMYDLSIASYGSLLKASYSALTVLLRFRHD